MVTLVVVGLGNVRQSKKQLAGARTWQRQGKETLSPGLVVRDGKHLHGGRVLLVEGVVQREDAIINVIAQRVGSLGVG